MSNRYGPRIVTDGLVLCLDAADRNSYPLSGDIWYDLSGNGNNGTLTNSPTFSSANGGCFDFNETDDHVAWTTLDAVKWQNWTSITVETAFNLESYTGAISGRQYLFDYRDSGTENGAFGCFHDNTILPVGFKLFYNTTGTTTESPLITTLSFGDLIYYQVTFDKNSSSNNIKHYINGENVYTRSITINSSTTNTGKVWLGRYSAGGFQWNGKIFFHKVYNRALSADEISQNYNATKGRFGL